jgi:hypothetical protein
MIEKVDKEMAEHEFVRFAEAAQIRTGDFGSDTDEKRFLKSRATFIHGVRTGSIIVDDEGWPTVKLEGYEFIQEVKFSREPTGEDRCVLDRYPDKPATGTLAWIASVVGRPVGHLRKLKERELDQIQAVAELF